MGFEIARLVSGAPRSRLSAPMRLQFLALTALPALMSAAYCSGKPSPDAQPNLHPIMTPTPTIIRSVPNAVLQRLGTGDDNISVVHLWGSAYAAHRSRKFCAISLAQNCANVY